MASAVSSAAPAGGAYCFTLDDNIRFLEESTRDGVDSIFEHPYPALLRRMHEKYGAKFQLNMYESYEPDSFSLRDAPDRWRAELEQNADWLRFSFHARNNDPPYPYEHAAPEVLLRDYRAVMHELRRIAGAAATDATTTLHYVCAEKEACAALYREGVRGLIGMFHPQSGRESLRYYLTPEQAGHVHALHQWCDAETGLFFVCNDMVLNAVPLERIIPELSRKEQPFYQVMIHEQYFYPDYSDYQPDFEQKVEAPLAWFQRKGLRSCFLEEWMAEEGCCMTK